MKLYIVGCGGVGKFIVYNEHLFLNRHYEIAGLVDDDPQNADQKIGKYSILGTTRLLLDIREPFAVAIGVADPVIKKKLIQKIQSKFALYPSLIASNAWISPRSTIGKGVIIYPGVTVNYETNIEDHVLLNMNCAIGHNCTIQQYSTLAPGVSLAGGTFLEEAVFLGINSATRQSVRIGAHTVVGGLAMVTRNLPPGIVAVGIPARPLNKISQPEK